MCANLLPQNVLFKQICAARLLQPERYLERLLADEPRIFKLFREKPLHQPPIPTPDHSASDTTATTLAQTGFNRLSSDKITLRWIVKVKMMARKRDVIFSQNAGW